MNSLFSETHAQEIIDRLERITPDQQPLWGKMNASQMMAHCNETMEVARGHKQLKRMFIGYVLGSLIKRGFYNDKPVPKNSPTHPTFIKTGQHELDTEREKLVQHIRAFQQGGPEKCTAAPHAFFGKITREQWGMGMYKHADHHLQQFGV